MESSTRTLLLSEASVFQACREARSLAEGLGWKPARAAELETAVSEAAQNAWRHAGGGFVHLQVVPEAGRAAIEVVVRDEGPGIHDLDRALAGGHSTDGTLGVGLSALTRLMDQVVIETGPSYGTCIRMRKSENAPPTPLAFTGPTGDRTSLVQVVRGPPSAFSPIEWARASRAIAGSSVSGDQCLVKTTSRGEVVAVVDGAGHGPAAAAVAGRALDCVRRLAERRPDEVLEAVRSELHGTTGAALTVASIDSREGTLTWSGIGNVDGMVLPANPRDKRHHLTVRAGTLGYRSAPARAATVPFRLDDRLVIWTDGVRSSVFDELDAAAHPVDLAREALLRGARAYDDALVFAARFEGGSLS